MDGRNGVTYGANMEWKRIEVDVLPIMGRCWLTVKRKQLKKMGKGAWEGKTDDS